MPLVSTAPFGEYLEVSEHLIHPIAVSQWTPHPLAALHLTNFLIVDHPFEVISGDVVMILTDWSCVLQNRNACKRP